MEYCLVVEDNKDTIKMYRRDKKDQEESTYIECRISNVEFHGLYLHIFQSICELYLI